MSKVEVKNKDQMEILIDGVDVSAMVTGIKLDSQPDYPTQIVLEIAPEKLDFFLDQCLVGIKCTEMTLKTAQKVIGEEIPLDIAALRLGHELEKRNGWYDVLKKHLIHCLKNHGVKISDAGYENIAEDFINNYLIGD